MIAKVNDLDDRMMNVYSKGVAATFTKERLDLSCSWEYCPVDLR